MSYFFIWACVSTRISKTRPSNFKNFKNVHLCLYRIIIVMNIVAITRLQPISALVVQAALPLGNVFVFTQPGPTRMNWKKIRSLRYISIDIHNKT